MRISIDLCCEFVGLPSVWLYLSLLSARHRDFVILLTRWSCIHSLQLSAPSSTARSESAARRWAARSVFFSAVECRRFRVLLSLRACSHAHALLLSLQTVVGTGVTLQFETTTSVPLGK